MGFIYAIQAEGTPYVKIGSTSSSVERRLQQLQTGHPLRLSIVDTHAVKGSPHMVEKCLHAFLRQSCVRSEWFELDLSHCSLAELIESALEVAAESRAAQPPRSDGMTMSNRISHLRKRKGWSQAELSRQVHIAQSTLHAYEAGTRPALGMSVDIARRFAQVFGVTVDYLVGVYDEEPVCPTCGDGLMAITSTP